MSFNAPRLMALRDLLRSPTVTPKNFDMRSFMNSLDLEADPQPSLFENCGATACALGWAAVAQLAPVPRRGNLIDWCIFASEFVEDGPGSLAYEYLFGSAWGYTEHHQTAEACAERIDYLLTHGAPPPDFEGSPML